MTTILIVDDDVALRDSLARDVRGQSHEVLVASSYDEAIAAFDEAERIDVLITDLRMPERDGLDLVKAVRSRSPETSTILMSAYAMARDYDSAMELGSVEVLTKPFARAELHAALARALESRRGYRGAVHGLTMVDLLQMFHFNRASVAILVDARDRVELRDGEIIYAEAGDVTGREALRALITRQAGHVRTESLARERDADPELAGSFDAVVIDTLRSHDEVSRPIALPVADSGLADAAGRLIDELWLATLPGWCTMMAWRFDGSEAVLLLGEEPHPFELVLAMVDAARRLTAGVGRGVCGGLADDVGLACAWSRDRDLILSLSQPITSAIDKNWFRSHSAALAKCVE